MTMVMIITIMDIYEYKIDNCSFCKLNLNEVFVKRIRKQKQFCSYLHLQIGIYLIINVQSSN